MYESFWHPKCPKNQKASTICLSHNCPHPPFQCNGSQCLCTSVHSRCKSMQWEAVRGYLQNWKKNICKEGKDFMSRIQKVFGNLKGKLQREEKIFQDYCKDNFLGKDYSKLIYLLQKKQQKSITSELVSAALRNMTEPTRPKQFNSFTLSQMQNMDKLSDQLFSSLDKLYHSKEKQSAQVDKIKRCNSAVLQRSKTNIKSTFEIEGLNKSVLNNFVNMKLDLTFPKIINSKIVSQATALNKLLNRKIKKYNLVYRASEHTFSIPHFYLTMQSTHHHLTQSALKINKKIDLLSLILVKTQFGKILGGFTPLKWEQSKQVEESDEEEQNPERSGSRVKHQNKFRGDPSGKTSFFSLDLMERYDLKKPEEAIYCGRKSIGFGKGDFKILDKGHILRKNTCKFPQSYNYIPHLYQNWSKSGMQLMGGRYSTNFKLLQWQSFLVQF